MKCNYRSGRTAQLVVMLVMAVGVALSAASPASAASRLLDVNKYAQAKTQWCWVAASKSIINYHEGTNPAQCTIHKWGKNASSCPNTGGTWADYQRAFQQAGMSNTGTQSNGAASKSRIVNQIDNRRPLIARISWKDGQGKKTGVHHAAPIRGYQDDGQNVRWIYIANTASNTEYRTSTHSYFSSNSGFDQTKHRYGMR